MDGWMDGWKTLLSHSQDQDLFVTHEADRKAFFSLLAVNESADKNEISFTAKTKRKRKWSVFFSFSYSVTKSAFCAGNRSYLVQFRFFAGGPC